jgi:DNA adenine methylase
MSRCVYRGSVKRDGTRFLRQGFYNCSKKITDKSLLKLHSNFLRLHQYLQTVNIECNDFESALEPASEGDFIYADPPYYFDNGEGHISYDNENTETERLLIHPIREVLDEMSRRKVKMALSMSDYPYVRALFADYTIHTVETRRNLRSGCKIVTELLITNY